MYLFSRRFRFFAFLILVFIHRAAIAAPTSKGAPMKNPALSIEAFFNGLSKDKLHLVDEFYDPEVTFEDPIGRKEGIEELRAYYRKLYETVESIRFEIHSQRVGDEEFAPWVMHLKAAGLNGGKEIRVPGVSQLRYRPGGKVLYHRDYFDMGAFIYEHVPVLGSVLGYIKRRMEK